MNQKSQQGIALVVTLIMLAIVTFMAVVFLAVSRRERASVTVTSNLTDARLMADAARARAEAEVVSRILGTTNRFNYDLIVSTNYINPFGFQPGVTDPTNVNYTYGDGQFLNRDDLLQNIANLQIDPRVPVFIPTNAAGGTDFRFYLDFNRNGRFETNGFVPVMERDGSFFDTNGAPTSARPPEPVLVDYLTGDPHWIGMLERPLLPHSETNQFVGRYAYLVAPAGKALDLNFIHNNVKRQRENAVTRDGFLRNQGVGSWEINLAAFLTELNTNAWGIYGYSTNQTASSVGPAFENALSVLRYRYADSMLPSIRDFLGPRAAVAVTNDLYDTYSDGPLWIGSPGYNLDNPPDQPTLPWAGSDNPRLYSDIQDIFDTNKTSPDFVQRLLVPAAASQSTHDRYTFYRMLAQLGTDSAVSYTNSIFARDFAVGFTNQINLNYDNVAAGTQTNFIEWNAQQFFYHAADRLLRASLKTNVVITNNVVVTNFVLGGLPVRPDISVTNIQVYHRPMAGQPFYMTNNEYTATLHRVLQLAANMYDATTNRTVGSSSNLPTIFRPTFLKTTTNIVINGYVEDATLLSLDSTWWRTLEELASPLIPPGPLVRPVYVYGVPMVVGAKKGYPNFNEFSIQNVAQVSRKLEVRKDALEAPPPWHTNQMYILSVSNVFGIEAWNSYTQDFRRNFEIEIENEYTFALKSIPANGDPELLLRMVSGAVSTNITGSTWTNRTFQTLQTNINFLPQSIYLADKPPYFYAPDRTTFEASFQTPNWILYATNRLRYIMVDRDSQRIVDVASFDNMVSVMEITRALLGDTNSVGTDLVGGGGISPGVFWDTRTVDGTPGSLPVGITNQIGVSLGLPETGNSLWANYSAQGALSKEEAIDKFRAFLGMSARYGNFRPEQSLSMQAPFTPTRKILQTMTWQANDPLVHYTLTDLIDPLVNTGTNYQFVVPPTRPVQALNIGAINERYRPWGGNPVLGDPTGDPTAYDYTLKDPGVHQPDDWAFPTNKLPNVGWLGRVHRGTPWQTIYLKSGAADLQIWERWAGTLGTHPTNDWPLVDLFTTAVHDNAARGLLSVNQTNIAAWAAVLGGTIVLTNTVLDFDLYPEAQPQFAPVVIRPRTAQLNQIVAGINRTRAQQPGGRFMTKGAILATPELSDRSPYLNLSQAQQLYGLNDIAYERIPQQILSLLKPDEPRFVIYAFGQSLKPADRSLVTSGKFYNLCTNYQITGEFVSKTVVRVEPVPPRETQPATGENPFNTYRTVVESYEILPPQ